MDTKSNDNHGTFFWTITILIVAMGLRFIFALGADIPVGGDANHYLNIAEEIRTNHRFALNDRVTAHRPPLYPLFLATVQSVSENQDLVRILQCLMSVGVLFILISFARPINSNRTGLLAALSLGALSPSWIFYSATLFSEVLFAFLLSLSIFILVKALRSNGCPSLRLLALSGVLLGLATLTRSVVLLLPPFFLGIASVVPGQRRFLKPLLILTFAWGLTLLPWTIRNYVQFQAFIPVNTMGGIVLWQGANPSPEGFGFTPWEEIDQVAATHDEVERNRVLTQEALGRYWADPMRTLKLAALKLLWFWNPWDGDTYRLGSSFNPHTFVLIFLSGWFLIQSWLERKERSSPQWGIASWVLPSLLVYFIAMALLFYGSPRFRMPVEPILWISAGFGFAGILRLKRGPRELALVLLLGSTLVLYLAGDSVKDILRSGIDMIFGYREFWGKGSP